MGPVEGGGGVHPGVRLEDGRAAGMLGPKTGEVVDGAVHSKPPAVLEVVVSGDFATVTSPKPSPPGAAAESMVTCTWAAFGPAAASGWGGARRVRARNFPVDVVPPSRLRRPGEASDRQVPAYGERHREVAVDLAPVPAEEAVVSGVSLERRLVLPRCRTTSVGSEGRTNRHTVDRAEELLPVERIGRWSRQDLAAQLAVMAGAPEEGVKQVHDR